MRRILYIDEFYNGETRKVYSDKDAVVQSSEEPKKAVKNKENKAEKEIVEVLKNGGFEKGAKRLDNTAAGNTYGSNRCDCKWRKGCKSDG